MFRFRVLGTVDLRGPDGRRVGSVLNQPKRLALLALLALEAPRRLQREEVMGRLWPEMSEERARNALRQALHYLRRSLGPGVITGAGAEGIGIASESMDCDATELVRAVEEGRFGEALALYEGELLPGFHVEGAPVELDHWLDDSRRRLQRLAADAARKLAEQEEREGNAVGAAAAARRAWELGHWGEPALQELLRLLLRAGDEKGARDAYAEFARTLRREHGAEPSVETREIIRALGEPELSGVESDPGTGGAAIHAAGVKVVDAAAVTRRAGWRGREWRALLVAALAVVLVGLGVWVMSGEETAGELVDGPLTLYLEPVRDLRAEGGFPRMADVLTAELAGQLSESSRFRVVALDPAESPAGEAGVRLRPSLQDEGNGLQLSVLMLDPGSAVVLDRVTVGGEPGSGITPERLVWRLAPQIRQGIGDVLELRVLQAEATPPAALAALRDASAEVDTATALWSRGAVGAAVLAYAEADSLFRRAAELDPRWQEPQLRRAEATVKLAWLRMFSSPGDQLAAHEEIVRGLTYAEDALEMAADPARALEVRGFLEYWAGHTAADRETQESFHGSAERSLAAAVAGDPGLTRAWSTLSLLAERRADYGVAYQRARRAYAADYSVRMPVAIMVRLFTNALEVGDLEGAARWCEETHRRGPDHWAGYFCDLRHRAWAGPWDVAASDSVLQEGLSRLAPQELAANVGLRLELVHAVVLAKAGEAEAARSILRSAATAGAASPDLLDLQAWVRLSLGDRAGAQKLLARASEISPGAAQPLIRSQRYADLSVYVLARRDE